MFVLAEKISYELVVKKSRFIALIYPFHHVDELTDKLALVKKEYPKAKHYLYLYKLGNLTRCNDDQEPGSIMKAVLTMVDKKEINNLLIIVVRYFGGTKLGAANLLRTYLKVCNEALKLANIKELTKLYQYKGRVDYSTFNQIKSRGYFIANARYFDTIEIEIISKLDILDELKQFTIKDLKVEMVEKLI